MPSDWTNMVSAITDENGYTQFVTGTAQNLLHVSIHFNADMPVSKYRFDMQYQNIWQSRLVPSY